MNRDRWRLSRRGSCASRAAHAALSFILERAGARRGGNSRKAARTKLFRLANDSGAEPGHGRRQLVELAQHGLGVGPDVGEPLPFRAMVRVKAQHKYFFRRVGIVSLSSIVSRISPSVTMVPASVTGMQVAL